MSDITDVIKLGWKGTTAGLLGLEHPFIKDDDEPEGETRVLMPDEDKLRREARKLAAKRIGGRARTMLTKRQSGDTKNPVGKADFSGIQSKQLQRLAQTGRNVAGASAPRRVK